MLTHVFQNNGAQLNLTNHGTESGPHLAPAATDPVAPQITNGSNNVQQPDLNSMATIEPQNASDTVEPPNPEAVHPIEPLGLNNPHPNQPLALNAVGAMVPCPACVAINRPRRCGRLFSARGCHNRHV